jgi:hypothetical protein
MNDEELHKYCWHNLSFLDPAKVAKAVEVLRIELASCMDELKQRISEDRKGWLMGRPHEFPLHHGFGTGVRNTLRSKGCDEHFFGIRNLDDYYLPMCELAAGFTNPYTS